jgi:hypothetical protein
MKLVVFLSCVLIPAATLADSRTCYETWRIGNIGLPICYGYFTGDPPLPECPAAPDGFINDVADMFNFHASYRLVTSTAYPPSDWPFGFIAPNGPEFTDLKNYGEIRFSGFDLALGGRAGHTILNVGTWSLLTDNDIVPYGALPSTFTTSSGGVFRKVGGSGVSTISIPFNVVAGGTLDVQQGTLAIASSAGFQGASITGAGTVRVLSNAFFVNCALSTGSGLPTAAA